MTTRETALPGNERRKYPRYYVNISLKLAIENDRLSESMGIGEPDDISLGGVRVRNLPACPYVKVGDELGMLLMDREDALNLQGEVVHHSTPDTFGVEFQNITAAEQRAIGGIIARLHAQMP